ncbi:MULTISPECIES: hypothetical protein [unclassified Anabaena]|uniref:hypothetical protein n=1 Tax=unclassified Anabaena TaxID=2619674 RepID=UPI0014484031|nr:MULTISPECIES: hypothetical protein [unclassified Anabaena]MTJ08808.1 hypothetical protein [Anabaena sp. UHCC 0204]MTJ53110.1 hypothetical protein [Anabaena sp. UHCC 0253]
MTIIERIKCIIPSFLLIGIGILEINYPHFMDNFDDGYTGRGISGFIMLLFELFIKFTWGKIEGFIAIIIGIFLIVIFLLPDFETKNEQTAEQTEINNQKKSLTKSLSSAAFRAGKSYLQRKYDQK